MSLIGALNIGKNALAVAQTGIQVTSNNIANAGNPNYTRQTVNLANSPDHGQAGFYLGTGVQISSIGRQIDEALQSRLRAATGDNQSADASHQWLSRVESVFDALGTSGLSSQLSSFFNGWTKLASSPQDAGQRQIVLTNGTTLARGFNGVRQQLDGIRSDIDQQVGSLAGTASDLSKQIADLNGQISVAEGGSGSVANGLRDQRDGLLKQLGSLVDIRTTQDKGQVSVFIGSQPLVLGNTSRGLRTVQSTGSSGEPISAIQFADNGDPVSITSGQIGGLVAARDIATQSITKVDTLADNLIYELNRIHSASSGLTGLKSVASSNSVNDPNAPLGAAGLKHPPANGSFVVSIKNNATGLVTSKLIKVTVGGPTAGQTTLNSLASQINDPNIAATVTGGQLTIAPVSSDYTVSFSQDTSGALASLGINNFFTGSNAGDIAVNATLTAKPSLLGVSGNGEPTDNSAALAIAALDRKTIGGLDGSTLRGAYDGLVNGVATTTAAASATADGTAAVVQTLTSQRESLSGVSVDEESVNLIQQQRAFQGAARLLSTIDELLQEVINLGR